MESLEEGSCWDFLDYDFIEETTTTTTSHDFLWSNNNNNNNNQSDGGIADIDFSSSGGAVSEAKQCVRKRKHSGDSCSKPVTKACREKLRRERLNDRFQDLSSVLEPDRPARIDKPALLDEAIKVLNQLKTEAQELKESNEKLVEEIKSLKAEKNELREEKLTLKADKEKMEQQLKVMAVPSPGFMPTHPAAYHAAMNKMAVYSGYGLIPMWQLPPAARDTSKDHEYWPPAA